VQAAGQARDGGPPDFVGKFRPHLGKIT